MDIAIQTPPSSIHNWRILTAVVEEEAGYILQLRRNSTVLDTEFFLDEEEVTQAAGILLERFNDSEFYAAVVGNDITFINLEDIDDE